MVGEGGGRRERREKSRIDSPRNCREGSRAHNVSHDHFYVIKIGKYCLAGLDIIHDDVEAGGI